MAEPDRPVVLLQRLDDGLPAPRYARAGIAIALEDGWAAFVHPRSGLAARSGLTIVNAPGTVDSGYRGEIRVCLLNTDRHRPVILHRGDLIAQLVFQRVGQARFVEVPKLPSSERGEGGYGSTGGVRQWSDEIVRSRDRRDGQ